MSKTGEDVRRQESGRSKRQADVPFWILVLRALVAHSEENEQSEFTKQEVAVIAFQAYPEVFCLQGYPGLVDSNRVFVILFGKLRREGWVSQRRFEGETWYSVAKVPKTEDDR